MLFTFLWRDKSHMGGANLVCEKFSNLEKNKNEKEEK